MDHARRRLLGECLPGFEESLRAAGHTEGYVKQTSSRVWAVVSACRCGDKLDLPTSLVESFLAKLAQGEASSQLITAYREAAEQFHHWQS
jgi:hypothetical protein